MNISELARRLRVSPKELREKLPRMGFDIGAKAIKIDKKIAKRILESWGMLNRKLEEEDKKIKKEELEQLRAEKREVFIPNFVTINEFSKISGVLVSNILKELMKNGIFASLNEKIDQEIASIIGEDLGLDVKLKSDEEFEEQEEEDELNKVLKNEDDSDLKARPPVVVVMGHVDHGKTRLLDTIRDTNVVSGESGGITQHIGAYQAIKNDRLVTFIDTPGHEAFTAMRSRGAKVADVAILIVAADDGVKSQTVEAFKIIKSAGIPFLIAMNKIDKKDANIDKTKQEISSKLHVIPEDWGGKIICAPVSAETGEGVQDMLDNILLLADTECDEIKANPNSLAVGAIVESHVDKSTGVTATILIQNGSLKVGDRLCLDDSIYGKVKKMEDYNGKNVTEAKPSSPVQIIGLKIAPSVGDVLVVNNDKKAKLKMKKESVKSDESESSYQAINDNESSDVEKLNIIIKGDVLGSIEAVEESLVKIDTNNVKIKIVHKGLGNIRESDVQLAESSNAQIIGFNVSQSQQIELQAREKNVKIKMFNVIYHLIEYIQFEMEKLLHTKIERTDLGKLKVLGVFRSEKDSKIIGGQVINGTINGNSKVEIVRDDEIVDYGEILEVKIGQVEVDEVKNGKECGLKYKGNAEIQINDVLNVYVEKEVKDTLNDE